MLSLSARGSRMRSNAVSTHYVQERDQVRDHAGSKHARPRGDRWSKWDERTQHPCELEPGLEARERPAACTLGSLSLHDRIERDLGCARCHAKRKDQYSGANGREVAAHEKACDTGYHQRGDEDSFLLQTPAEAGS